MTNQEPRPEGYYWIRPYSSEEEPEPARWEDGEWWICGADYPVPAAEVGARLFTKDSGLTPPMTLERFLERARELTGDLFTDVEKTGDDLLIALLMTMSDRGMPNQKRWAKVFDELSHGTRDALTQEEMADALVDLSKEL